MVGTFESLINPQRSISPGASVVHRLTDWDAADRFLTLTNLR